VSSLVIVSDPMAHILPLNYYPGLRVKRWVIQDI